jgi:hypothetical protein
MDEATIRDRISRGRTDLVFEFLKLPDWRELLHAGQVKLLNRKFLGDYLPDSGRPAS